MAEEEVLKVEEAETPAESTEETEEQKKQNKFMLWIKEHPKAFFWIRFGLWSLCACVLPFLFIALRFEIFKSVSKLQFGGWGIIAIIVVAVFTFTVVKYVRLALNAKYTLTGQILNGICKVIIPLLVLLAVLYCVRDSVIATVKVLGIIIFLEAVAIPLNPLPKWVYEKQKDVKESERKETVDYLLDGFFNRKDKTDSGGN